MKRLPTERKQDSFKVGNVTTELLWPLGSCHPIVSLQTGMLERGLSVGGQLGSGSQIGVPGSSWGGLLVIGSQDNKGQWHAWPLRFL